jgi:hemolysin III
MWGLVGATTLVASARRRRAQRPGAAMPAAPKQSPREEAANTASHGVGVLLALAAMPVLAADGAADGPLRHIGLWVFAATMLLLYLVSSAYHAAIYLFMAGSFTPFALGHVHGGLLLTGVWLVAAAGVALKLCGFLGNTAVSTGMFLAFGWFVLAAAQPLLANLGRDGLLWLLAGAIAYTAGTVFFVLDQRLRFGHLVWHLFVLTGSGCHFVAVLKHSGSIS